MSYRQRCAQLNLKPELYTQSITHLSLPHKYSTVTIAVGSFQLITDRALALQALKSIRSLMLDNGNLLIDIFVPDMALPTPSICIARVNNHTTIRLTTHDVFHEQELIQVTWYTDAEFESLLNQASFHVIKFYEETLRPGGPSRIVHAKAA